MVNAAVSVAAVHPKKNKTSICLITISSLQQLPNGTNELFIVDRFDTKAQLGSTHSSVYKMQFMLHFVLDYVSSARKRNKNDIMIYSNDRKFVVPISEYLMRNLLKCYFFVSTVFTCACT